MQEALEKVYEMEANTMGADVATTDFDGTTRLATYLDSDITSAGAFTIAAANS